MEYSKITPTVFTGLGTDHISLLILLLLLGRLSSKKPKAQSFQITSLQQQASASRMSQFLINSTLGLVFII